MHIITTNINPLPVHLPPPSRFYPLGFTGHPGQARAQDTPLPAGWWLVGSARRAGGSSPRWSPYRNLSRAMLTAIFTSSSMRISFSPLARPAPAQEDEAAAAEAAEGPPPGGGRGETLLGRDMANYAPLQAPRLPEAADAPLPRRKVKGGAAPEGPGAGLGGPRDAAARPAGKRGGRREEIRAEGAAPEESGGARRRREAGTEGARGVAGLLLCRVL